MTISPSYVPQNACDRITRRWWFVLVFLLVNMIPPIVSKPLKPEEWQRMGDIYGYILGRSLLGSLSSPWWIVANIVPVVLIALVFVDGRRFSRVFSAYAAVAFVFFAVLQNVSITEKYGFAVVTCNFLWFMFLAVIWAWETFAGLNDLSRLCAPAWRYWVAPLMLYAFWLPLAPGRGGAWRFDPLFFARMNTGLAFCLMTPVYLGILTLFYPRVNLALLRVTALTGIVLAFYNMLHAIMSQSLFTGLAHVPLASISIYALALSYRRVALKAAADAAYSIRSHKHR